MTKPGKVLVIDDDPDFLQVTQLALERDGHEVVAAADGAEGLHKAETERPEVVILDLLMAPQDGFAICESLRKTEEARRPAILVISAIGEKLHKSFSSLDVGTRLDVDGYLDKPVDLHVLVRTVNELLQVARARAAESGDGEPR